MIGPDRGLPVSHTPIDRLVYLPARCDVRTATVVDRLGCAGLPVARAVDLADALRALADTPSAACVIDLGDEEAAVPAVHALRAHRRDLPIIGVVDPAWPIVAAEALHAGVADLLPWPFDDHHLLAAVANACDRATVAHAGAAEGSATATRDAPYAGARLFAHSPAMRQVLDAIRATAASDGGVLVVGEPGSGREMVARAIHARSRPAAAPFIAVDCANGTAETLEQRLFGFRVERPAAGEPRALERIARTSSIDNARGGTLYLINIVSAAARVQARLARVLRDGEAAFVGERPADIDLDLRIVAAAAPDIDAALADGRLRRDLYQRLAATRIDVPPLRRRPEDIPLLAVDMLDQLTVRAGLPPRRFSRSALTLLAALPWPRNGHELRQVVHAMLQGAARAVLHIDDVLAHVRFDGMSPVVDAVGSLRDAKRRFERDWISAVLVKHHGRVEEAARAMGIRRTNLYRKVRELDVARNLLARKT